MHLPLNRNETTVMHIDLNACFASVEQQANPLLRGRPVCVAAYTTPNGCVISPSYEAKQYGIKVGMQVRDARMLCKDVVVLPPDPQKYRYIHIQFCRLFREYAPVVPKSIDEAVLDFAGTPAMKRGLISVGQDIKRRMRKEIGSWLSCNIGIASNRFLAKLAASLHKPDGLTRITHTDIEPVYQRVALVDLCGINTRYQARLNAASIFTPLDFLNARLQLLEKQVFQSINGYYWYLRLRGWEIDAVDFSRKSYGQSYALQVPTDDPRTLAPMILKLCEKMGRRLRRGNYTAQGIHVSCLYRDGTHWHQGRLVHQPMYTTMELYRKALLVFNAQPERKVTSHIAVSCYHLAPTQSEQLDLFDGDRQRQLAEACDKINDKYGEFVVTPALMMGMKDIILDRISFGGVKDLEEVYAEGE